MKFKGTKGELVKIYQGDICIGIGVPITPDYHEVTENSILPDCEGWSDKKIDKHMVKLEADMTLYSQSPEMLRMLKTLLKDGGFNEFTIRETELLIKKATTI